MAYWGFQYELELPNENAALGVARELAGRQHRLIRAVPRQGWWALSSLAVYPTNEKEALQPFLCWEQIRVAALARSYSGLCWGGFFDSADELQRKFPRDALLHEELAAEVTLPVPLPADPMPAEFGPRWTNLRLGTRDEVVTAVAAVARGMYGKQDHAPDAVAWLLDEQALTEQPDESTQGFLDDLLSLMCYPRPGHDTTAAIPLIAALSGEEAVPAGVRVSMLGALLRQAVAGDEAAVSVADRLAMHGGRLDTRATNRDRDAVVREVPRLLDRWEQETDPARFLLAALATVCPAIAADRVLPRLGQIPAPEVTARADSVALIAALLTMDSQGIDHALRKVASWHLSLTQDLSSPHTPIVEAARATLASLAIEDARTAVIP